MRQKNREEIQNNDLPKAEVETERKKLLVNRRRRKWHSQ